MVGVAGGSFSPNVSSLISPASNPRKPINFLRCPQSFRPLSSSATNPKLTLSRLKLVRGTAVTSKRPCRVLAVSVSLDGKSDSYREDESNDSNAGATVDMKLPRRRLLVEFTCNECGERSQRLINRLAYEKGLVYVQCAGCLRHHKLVDNLGLVVEYDLRHFSTEPSADQV